MASWMHDIMVETGGGIMKLAAVLKTVNSLWKYKQIIYEMSDDFVLVIYRKNEEEST